MAKAIILEAGQPADYLTDKPLLSPDDLARGSEIDPLSLPRVTETEFERVRTRKLFEPPLVLIGQTLRLPVVYWDAGPVAYRKQIVGVHADRREAADLRAFFETIRDSREIYQFWVAATSSRAMVSMATSILKADIDSLPYCDFEGDAQFCHWEQVLARDVVTYLASYVRLGQNSQLLKRRAELSDIREYSALFCQMLGSIYDNLRADDPVFLNGLICQPFYFGDEPAIEWLGPDCEEQLMALVFDNSRESLRTVRVVRYYHENVIFIVKPDRLRFWIKSTAIRDADDTLIDLQRQGY